MTTGVLNRRRGAVRAGARARPARRAVMQSKAECDNHSRSGMVVDKSGNLGVSEDSAQPLEPRFREGHSL